MSALGFDAAGAAAHAILVAPLLGALGAFALPGFRAAWILSMIAALIVVACALALAVSGANTAAFGLSLDPLARAAAPIVAIAGALCVIAAGKLAPEDTGPRAASFALALLQIAWFGWLGAAIASGFLPFIGFFEIGWIASGGLMALGLARERAALSAAATHLVWGAAFGLVFAIGAALAFNASGALGFEQIGATGRPRALAAGYALMITSVAGAAGLAPLNAWATVAFDRGGRLGALIIAGAGFAAMAIALARIAVSARFAGGEIAPGAAALIATLGALSMAIGSVQAIGARDLRRLAAYACAAQAGAVALSLALMSVWGVAAAVTHIAVSVLAALGLMGGAALIEGRAPLAALDGMGRRAPIAGAAIALSALSLVSTPLTAGFVSRWRLVESALGGGWWWAGGAFIAASLAAVIYVGRLVERLYLKAPGAPRGFAPRAFSLAPMHILVIAATIGFGLEASGLWRIARAAGEGLIMHAGAAR